MDQGLGAYVADGIAVRLGLHPVVIWPDWFAHSPTEEEVTAAEMADHLDARLATLRRQSMSYRQAARPLAAEGFLNPFTGLPCSKDSLRLRFSKISTRENPVAA